MPYCDFIVKWDKEKESTDELAKKIIYAVIVRRRLKAHKPAVLFISGDSGEGKSFSVLRLQEILAEAQGLNIHDIINDINVYTPLEYAQKIDALLHDKKLRKVNMLGIHEARELIRAKLWYNFLNQAVSDVNAMSRSIKRLCIFIVSQFIRDISTDIRYTLNFYIKAQRPAYQRTRLYFYVLWKDDSNLEKPMLRKRRLFGYIVSPDGRYRRFVPKYFEVNLPDKRIIQIFEEQDFKSKASIIRKKLDKLIKQMNVDVEAVNAKVDAMVKFYSENTDSLMLIGKRRKTRFVIKPEVKIMHDISDLEFKEFQEKINIALKKKKLFNPEYDADEIVEDNFRADDALPEEKDGG